MQDLRSKQQVLCFCSVSGSHFSCAFTAVGGKTCRCVYVPGEARCSQSCVCGAIGPSWEQPCWVPSASCSVLVALCSLLLRAFCMHLRPCPKYKLLRAQHTLKSTWSRFAWPGTCSGTGKTFFYGKLYFSNRDLKYISKHPIPFFFFPPKNLPFPLQPGRSLLKTRPLQVVWGCFESLIASEYIGQAFYHLKLP